MGIFDKLFGSQRQKKPTFEHVKHNVDPSTHYDLVGKLGEGAFGDVWKAKNKITQKYSAAKIIEISSESEIEEHYGEIEILVKCNHRNIVDCVDSIYWESKLWILIEYCEGGALDDIIEKIDHGLSEEQTSVVVCRTVAGLLYLHSSGIIHRDLKAGNILLMPNGDVKIADFGVSALNNSVDQTRDTFIGTPYWMAPEVIMCETSKSDPYNYSADVWSLGITIIELVQMEPPHNEFSPNRVLMKIARGDAPRLRSPDLYSFPMNRFVEICLQKNPRDRPTCAELVENQWIVAIESNKPLRQLLAETRAEVLEEVIKNEQLDKEASNKPKLASSIGASSDEVSETSEPDELTTYEKGVQKKFNSVSSSISSNSSVSIGGGGSGNGALATVNTGHNAPSVPPISSGESTGANGDTNQPIIIQNVTKTVEQLEATAVQITENEEVLPANDEIEIEVVNEEIVKINRKDGSVSGTIFGASPKTNKPTAMDIANRMSLRRSSLPSNSILPSKPILTKNKTIDSSLPSALEQIESSDKITDVTEQLRQFEQKKKPESKPIKVDKPMPNDKEERTENKDVIESKQGGTWFGSKRNKEQIRPKATDAIKNLEAEKAKETEALEQLENAVIELDDKKTEEKPESVPVSSTIKRRGASRDSYKNATTTPITTPDLAKNRTKPLGQIVETRGTVTKTTSVPLKDEELTKDEKAKRQKKTLKRTRKFILDGEEVVVTSTVTKSDADVERQSEKRIMRRQELQELRKLQIEEQRKMGALQHKLGTQTEQLSIKCERELQDLNRMYSQKIEALERSQKSKIEKMEATQAREQKEMIGSLKKEQQRELDAFNSNMRQEQQELKKQVSAQFSDRKSRNNTFKNRKTQLDQHQKYKEGAFRAKQDDKLNEAITKFSEEQKKSVAETERSALLQRQELLRERESKTWDTEESHLQEKHQTARSQLKDQFLLQKMLLVVRHDKEVEQITRHNERLLKALEDRQRADRTRLPKWQRNDGKTRETMFKQSIRIQNPTIDPKEELEKLREFKSNEEKRQDNERLRQQQKHERQKQELNQRCESNINELKQIQNEKRRLLVETETQKLKDLDDSFKKKFDSWRDKLGPRKQELEEQFSRQMQDWEQFFSQQDLPQTPSGSKRLSNFYRIG